MCLNDEGRAGGGLWQACFFFNNLLQHDWNTSRISAFVLLVSSNYYFNLHSPQRCYNMSAKINRLVHCLQIFKLDFFQLSNLFVAFGVSSGPLRVSLQPLITWLRSGIKMQRLLSNFGLHVCSRFMQRVLIWIGSSNLIHAPSGGQGRQRDI